MKMLWNSSKGLLPIHNWLIYRIYILSIILVWISTLVLQKNAFVSIPQRIEENKEKSNIIDYRSIFYIANLENWGYN